jgi:predicted sugar kinase
MCVPATTVMSPLLCAVAASYAEAYRPTGVAVVLLAIEDRQVAAVVDRRRRVAIGTDADELVGAAVDGGRAASFTVAMSPTATKPAPNAPLFARTSVRPSRSA